MTDQTTNIAPIENADESTGDKQQFLTFLVDDTQYGVALMDIQEIRVWSETTPIPNSPDYMRGVINLRGQVIPIFDLRARFDRGETQTTDKHVIVVLNAGERVVGLLVDAVSDIISADDSDIQPPPSHQDSDINADYVEGLIDVDGTMIVALNITQLFQQDSLHADEAIITKEAI